jgi:hypothetical protein
MVINWTASESESRVENIIKLDQKMIRVFKERQQEQTLFFLPIHF